MTDYYTRRVPVDPRYTLWDRYPRQVDPMRPEIAVTPQRVNPQTAGDIRSTSIMVDIFRNWRVRPSTRPVVYQNWLPFGLIVQQTETSVMNQILQVDAILFDNPSSNAASVFVGRGGVNALNSIEVRPGIPLFLGTDNTRQLWEVQTALQDIAALLAANMNVEAPQPQLSPRVVFNVDDFMVISPTAIQSISIVLFFPPELQ